MGSGADEIGAWVFQIGVDFAEQTEDSQQRVLHQVFAVPDVAGEAAAEAMQRWPQRRECIQIASPRTPDVGLHVECGIRF